MMKWVARLAILTALLGLIGTIIIISNISRNKKETKVETPSASVPDTQIIQYPAKPVITIKQPKSFPTEQKQAPALKNIPATKKTVEKIDLPLSLKNDDKKKRIANPEEAAKSEKQEESKKEPEEKLFTSAELQQLVARINRTREENGISSNCVQIHTTKQGNYPRTISQVETYLKSHRFAIAGREVVSTKVKGILISPNAGCIRVTIGTF